MPVVALAGAAVTAYGASRSASAQNRATESANALTQEQLAIERRKQEIAEENFSWYKQNIRPFEQEYLSMAKGLGSIANQNRSAQQAAATVASTFQGARDSLRENPGVDPGSQAYLQEQTKVNLAEAATSAAAQNAAREGTKDRGRAAIGDVVNMGKGMPSAAATIMSGASSGIGSAARYYQNEANRNGNEAAAGWGAAGRLVGGITNSADFRRWVGSFGQPDVSGSGGSNPTYPEYGMASGATGAWT